MSTNWLTFDEVLYLKGIEEMVEVYYNSNQFMNSLKYMLHFMEKPFDLFEALAAYYDQNELLKAKHSRIARYDILLDFAQTMNWEGFDVETFKAVLLFDLYLRENLKSRPKWAKDIQLFKDRVSAFYSDDELRQTYFSEYAGESYRSVRNATHIEIFDRDVFAAVERGVSVETECAVAFDYGKRDLLDGGCYAKVVCGI